MKLKNMYDILKIQEWKEVSRTGFVYRCRGWKNSRELKAIRILKGYKEFEESGRIVTYHEYEYRCYCSNLKDADGNQLHEIYKKRAESENRTGNVKNRLPASKTLTDSFHANDILWQLSVPASNVSVMMRYEAGMKYRKQEPKTFREWFIELPGKVISGGRQIKLKMYENYYYRTKWEEPDRETALVTG